MPIFKIRFEREVIERDEFYRYVEAENEADAEDQAAIIALAADAACPDDTENCGGSYCESWEANEPEEVNSIPDDHTITTPADAHPRIDSGYCFICSRPAEECTGIKS